MAIRYNTSTVRKTSPAVRPGSRPAPAVKKAARTTKVQTLTNAELRNGRKRRMVAVVVAILLMLALAVPQIAADAQAQIRGAAQKEAEAALAVQLQEQIRLVNELQDKVGQQIDGNTVYDIAVAEFGMVAAIEPATPIE
ncbi:MAG: hypothetical protein LBN05_07100 [Oscillospiraceae bacterium]|jgi:hypothetical protein|nr:hypothetical protein [Oscillospiraceae bacterium]